ncbi:hypothetical protein GMLC_06860 [Geomonas limicola]|uniref:Uncharacterized protein n=1 Tax=Geomonas limicola TaxID=2740186 RepID=A0A6V8N5L1_9BACT|nr:hypothetical protein [Geomonas limicola]GFO67107.1 hypothetical protein GMLC_06860 [Geomonas limicola]
MDTSTMLWYVGGGGAGLVLFLGIGYWVGQYVIQQLSQQALDRFREHLAKEVESALTVFREGVCQQIVEQGNTSDSLATLYTTLIEVLREGREFCGSCAKDDPLVQEKKLRRMGESCRSFAEQYQRESLHLSDDFCARVESFGARQMELLQQLEWDFYRKDQAERSKEREIRQHWSSLEDQVTEVMDLVRREFQNRNNRAGAVLLEGLKAQSNPGLATGPANRG